MTLASGTRLGRYEIRSQLAVGGMGEVYLAFDTELDRKVALKILPSDVASKQERMTRFVREAKAAAALNHPNIAHIYEIGTGRISGDGADKNSTFGTDIHFIAMEFVDGQTLREKIHRDSTDLRKLLRYLQQVAEGLAKAHAAGIVHRDLKPDNVMIARDGYAKILDFGLAKLVEPPASSATGDEGLSEVATAMMPQHSLPGTVMGTIGYMSPEQAQGRTNEVDHRSDIFAFGCILYEAATRQKAFKGKDALDSLHNIVHAPTPQIKDINPVAPDELQRIVRRCLAKDPDKRYQSIKDVAIEIDELRQELKGAELHDSIHRTASETTQSVGHSDPRETVSQSALLSSQVQSSPPTSSAKIILNELTRNKRAVALVLGTLAIVSIAGWFAWQKLGRQRQPSVTAGQMKITRLVTGVGRLGEISISPDGKYVAYAVYAQQAASLWVRQVSQDASLQIVPPLEDTWFQSTSFSPDGELIYFIGGNSKTNTLGSLYQIPVLGGREPKKILDHATDALTISPDGNQVAFLRYSEKTDESALMIANIDGSGEPRKLAVRQKTAWFSYFSWSPDGKSIAAAQATVPGGLSYTLVEIPVAGGPEKLLTDRKWSGNIGGVQWLSDGSGLVILVSEKIGDPLQYFYLSLPGGELHRVTSDLNDYGTFGITRDSSTMVGNLQEQSSQIWITAPGEEEGGSKRISNGKRDGGGGVAWTPDGRIVFAAQAGANRNLWIMNADGSSARALTSHAYVDGEPRVSPDGRFVVFQSFRPDNIPHIWRVDIDGSNLKQLTHVTEDQAPSFSSDGRWVVFQSWRSGSPNLWKVPIDGGEQVQISSLRLTNPWLSSDDKLILCSYYDESATPPRARPALVSAETGQLIRVMDASLNEVSHRWSRDGKEIVYAQTSKDITNIWSQPISGGPARQLTKFSSDFIASFDQSRDGKRFAIARATSSNEIVLIKDFK